LAAAGVPVAVAGDELPLSAEPGTRPLLRLLSCALRPGALDEESAAELLTGPLGGTDTLGLRRLRRTLQAAAQAAGQQPPAEPLATALSDPRELAVAGWPARPASDATAGQGAGHGAGAGAGRGGQRGLASGAALAAARRGGVLLALGRDTRRGGQGYHAAR